jgi:hypothetical protein
MRSVRTQRFYNLYAKSGLCSSRSLTWFNELKWNNLAYYINNNHFEKISPMIKLKSNKDGVAEAERALVIDGFRVLGC